MDPTAAGEEAARTAAPAVLRAAGGWEFATYLVGSSAPPGLGRDEGEAFRKSANRTLGTLLGEAWGGARLPEFKRPEMRFVVRFPSLEVELHPVPLFVYGRYRKHSRTLAQTPYHCPLCRGRGCRNCGGKGRLVEGSVAEFVLPALVEASGAAAGVFKGCGREDADVRMLGRGRPFLVELERPVRRTLDGEAIAARAGTAAGGAAEFPVLFVVARETGEGVPGTHPPKRYRARVEVEGGAGPGDGARLAAGLDGVVLAQRTPVRVTRRRADRVRERRVLEAAARPLDDGSLELLVRTEAGAYIKEMISGDGGRTVPSASSILGRPCRCVELDVLEVEMEDPEGVGGR